MYSGTTFRRSSGNVLGAHQKIDRLARLYIKNSLSKDIHFPTVKEILHFEGNNGPDGIKRKSPARDEPWHYFDPTDPTDISLIGMIEDHIYNLAHAMASDNRERAAFEAAWLAHAIVDGLTPAHHYHLSEKIEELWGYPKEMRQSIRDKNIIRGKSRRDTLAKNWQYWGAKGVFTTHFMFEFGFATTIAPLQVINGKPNKDELIRVQSSGVIPFFREAALKIHAMRMYEQFHRSGWTPKLAKQTKQHLAPLIIKTVALSWYYAAYQASLIRNKKNPTG